MLAVTIIFLAMNITTVYAQPKPDPTGDCLNLAGTPTSCEPYADIVSSDASISNGGYTGIITLAGSVRNVPFSASNRSTFIEWDIAIDADRNPTTKEWCFMNCGTTFDNLVVNGIGVDYMVRYWMNSSSSGAQIFDGPSGSWFDIQSYQVNGNQIQLSWLPGDIGGSKFFDYVILVRVYKNGGASDSDLLSFDKAPNVGHYEFQGGSLMWTTTVTNLYGQIGMGDFVLPIVTRDGLTGKSLTLSDFLGKVIVLEFMASWCPPCGQLAPFMERLYNQYANQQVVFISVEVGWPPCCGHKNVTITQFLNMHNSSLTYLYDADNRVTNMYSIESVPTLFVISKTGAIEQIDGRLEDVEPIEQHASAAIDAALAQVVVTVTSQTSTLSSSQSLQSSQMLATSIAQTTKQNPIPGFPIDSIMLGLMVGFVLLVIMRRPAFKRKSTSRCIIRKTSSCLNSNQT